MYLTRNGAFQKVASPQQKGFAVVMVLSVLAILLLLMTSIMSRNSQLQFRTIGLIHQQQAQAHMVGAEAWALEILVQDKDDSDYDDLTEIWAQQIPFIPIEGGGITGQIMDLSGTFFVNNLLVGNQPDPVWLKFLETLFQQQGGDANLVAHLVDWLDTNVNTSNNALEDGWYGNQPIPYRSANQPMMDISELTLVQGFDQALVNNLKNSLFALPLKPSENAKININTAPESVLEVLVVLLNDPQISVDLLVEKRPWQDLNDLPLTPPVPDSNNGDSSTAQNIAPLNNGNYKNYLTVKSEYFLLDTQALVGEQTSRLLSAIRRPIGASPVALLQRQWLPGN